MAKETIFVRHAKSEQSIQQIEYLLSHLEGIERVLLDTSDGELKIVYNERIISKEQISTILKENNIH
jgi:hypothetical protein